jgi:hypothetical protein
MFVVCSKHSVFFGYCQAPHFLRPNTTPWHIPFDISQEKAFNSFFLTSIAQEQINYSIPVTEPKTETPTSTRLSLAMEGTVAAFLLIAFILIRPWLPV